MGIFREEALKHHNDTEYGDIVLPASFGISVCTIATLFIFLSVALFVYYGCYTRKAHLTGIVMPSQESQLPGPEMTLRALILKMRNSVAHFSVQVVSVSDERLFDLIAFRDDPEDENAYATFSAPELLPFLKYYATLLLDNMARRRAPDVNILDL